MIWAFHRIDPKLKKAIMAHADECYPQECCGVIVGKEYIRCRNISDPKGNGLVSPKRTRHDLSLPPHRSKAGSSVGSSLSMKLTAKIKKAIMAHADECYPQECCGVIVGKEYIKATV
jgi:proteasome lid subunit RPN8/RPN11